MNWLDSLVAAFAPEAGLRRAAARAALDAMGETARPQDRYEAARLDRSLDDWRTPSTDANAEIGPQLCRIRNRARDLGRNDPFIARAYDILAAKIIGAGVRPRLAEEVGLQTRTRTMDGWKAWVEDCDPDGMQDLYGLQMIAARTMIESGEAIIRFIPVPSRGMRVPVHIRVLEPDWVDMDQHRPLDDGGQIIQGVEFDASGRRRAYWMFDQHPGADMFIRRFPTSSRIPANLVAPLYRQQRPDQVHGVPWAAPSVNRARHLDDINDAMLKRLKIQACFAAFVKKIDAGTPLGDARVDESGRRREKLAPGIIDYLRPDEDVEFATPPTGSGDQEWQVNVLHAMAAGLGVTYAQMTGDLRQVNYSSMRAGAIDHWALLDQWQRLTVQPMLCRPLWRSFDQYEAIRQGRSWLIGVDWDFPERALIDPTKDGQAIDEALVAGRKTFHEVIAGRGRDPEAHIAELRREREELAGLNLPHLAAPAPAAGGTPRRGQPEAPPPDTTDEAPIDHGERIILQ